MNRNWGDAPIKRLFEKLRQKDLSQLPSFREVLDEPAGKRAWTILPSWRYSAAAAVVLLFFSWALWMAINQTPDESASTWAVPSQEWQAPTDFLLDLPGGTLISTVPRLESEGFWENSEQNGDESQKSI